jgi:ferredoxin
MDAILKQDKVIPDCFSCGSCIEVCPTDTIRFTSKKREKPPQEMFTFKKLKVSKLKS